MFINNIISLGMKIILFVCQDEWLFFLTISQTKQSNPKPKEQAFNTCTDEWWYYQRNLQLQMFLFVILTSECQSALSHFKFQSYNNNQLHYYWARLSKILWFVSGKQTNNKFGPDFLHQTQSQQKPYFRQPKNCQRHHSRTHNKTRTTCHCSKSHHCS